MGVRVLAGAWVYACVRSRQGLGSGWGYVRAGVWVPDGVGVQGGVGV